MGHTGVGQVQVVGLCRIFCGQGVNLLDIGHDAFVLAIRSHLHDGLFHIHLLLQSDGAGHLEVGKALHLGFLEQFRVKVLKALGFLER